MLGYSINTLTLLAWVLAIGLVVDDSIVVLENIHRHIEQGLSSFEAALLGIREIGWAIIAMTLTLAAVYMPIGFLTGLTGSLFREFAFTLASAVIISGFVALTLSPLMCAKWLRHVQINKGFAAKLEEIFQVLLEQYRSLLNRLLKHPKLILGLAAIIYLSCYFLYISLPNELAPNEDQGAIMSFVSAPTSANLPYTEKYTKQIARIYQQLPETVTYGIVNGFDGVNSALSFLVLKPWNERKRSADEIIQALFPQFWSIPGVMAFPVNLPALPGTNERTPISFILKTTGSYENLYSATQKLLAKMRQEPRLLNVDTEFKWDKQQINLSLDRDKAAALGIPMSEISSALNLLLGQPTVTRFTRYGRSYDVIPQLLPAYSNQPQQLNNIYVYNSNGSTIPLANIAKLQIQTAPESLYHFQQQRAAKITASLAFGYTIGEALNDIQKMAKQVLPEDIQYDYAGQSRQFVQATGAMQQTFLFALLFIFLVLAAQFESFIDPIIVMLSVPLSLFGALSAMHLSGCTLNIYTQIGLVTLVGLISKHGILIVEFANQLRHQGNALHEAVINAASLRLRPILMTTGAMLLGALPLVIADGAGANSRQQIGMVIIGGMSFGTLLTLFIIPTVYLFVEKLKQEKAE
jgi:multidrug efflux pump